MKLFQLRDSLTSICATLCTFCSTFSVMGKHHDVNSCNDKAHKMEGKYLGFYLVPIRKFWIWLFRQVCSDPHQHRWIQRPKIAKTVLHQMDRGVGPQETRGLWTQETRGVRAQKMRGIWPRGEKELGPEQQSSLPRRYLHQERMRKTKEDMKVGWTAGAWVAKRRRLKEEVDRPVVKEMTLGGFQINSASE